MFHQKLYTFYNLLPTAYIFLNWILDRVVVYNSKDSLRVYKK